MKKYLLFLVSWCCTWVSAISQDSTRCNANFTYQIDGLTVKFFSVPNPNNHPLKHQWNFGNGSASTDPDPVVVFSGPGTYTVLHVVKDSLSNCFDSVRKVITVGTTNCTIEPKFEWRQDSVNCRKVWFINQSIPISPNVSFAWKFGDGSSSNEINPKHEYAQPGKYTVCLVIESGPNCRKEYCQTIEIRCDECPLQINFNYEKDSAQPNKVHFKSQVITPVAVVPTYKWSFGDGTYSEDANPAHQYANPGAYNVCLRVAISNTCVKELCKTIVIGDSCRLEVKWKHEADPQHPRRIKFTSETIVPASGAEYKWTFGDGAGSNDKDPVHIYEKPGEYKVCLKVAISNTCVRESCRTIIVDTPCRVEAKFQFRLDSLQKNKVYFHNLTVSTTQPVHYLWKFGDGTTSTDVNPIHVYQQPGKYEVCLVAETSNGCRSEYCAKVEIGSLICPIEARFEWKADQENPRKIYFHNLSILPSAAASFFWKFGDGTTSTEKNPVHVYEKPGEYEVCLIIELNNFCRKVSCQKIVIRPPECNVRARFEWKQDPQEWKKIWFANLSQPVPNIWRTHWYYGDGTTSQDFNSFHEYTQPGKYTVCLKVISLNGCIDAYCDTVIVRKKDSCEIKSEFKWERATNNALEVKFKPENINLTWKYEWKFGDGTSSSAVTPIHKFPSRGVYNVCLTVTQNNRCKTTTCKEVKVGAECDSIRVKYEYKRDLERPNKISFYAISSQPLVKQKWTIKRDSTINGFPYVVVLTQNNPTYIFPFSGWYTVCLDGATANGCTGTYCERIFIDRVVNAAVTLTPLPVYPNPASSLVRIDLKLEQAAPVRVVVLDEAGTQQMQLYVNGQRGNNSIQLPVSKLSQGQYLVQLVFANQVRLARFQRM